MKLHIFVATTQGLVAIQNITKIDDDEINSIVTVNGTSTTANISSAYHSFVKKGAGIIQQEFGGSSYRVNLSQRIDSGNSWQLAFYLAHVANAQNMLGNGQVKANDHVICATGEINTSERLVQPVEQVHLKQTLAKEQIEHWQQISAEITFLIPKGNEQNIEASAAKVTKLITTLEDAVNYLPVLAASKPIKAKNTEQTAVALLTNTDVIVNKNIIVDKKRSLKLTFFVGLFSVVVILVLLKNNFVFTQAVNHENNILTVKSASTKVQDESHLNTVPISITATLAKYGDCKDGIIKQQVKKQVTDQKQLFAATKLANLCQLTLLTPSEITTVILVAADTRAIRLLTLNEHSWQIPLPTTQNIDRRYYLVLLPSSKTETIKKIDYKQQLQQYLQREIKSPLVNVSHLQQWLNNNNWQGTIVSHTLDTY
ncbi:MAG: hypothetical protein OCD00_07405 [Colwellia sp.]